MVVYSKYGYYLVHSYDAFSGHRCYWTDDIDKATVFVRLPPAPISEYIKGAKKLEVEVVRKVILK